MDPARRPVMADVAGRAGVSVMTVSRVLNGFPGVAEDTRQRVEEAVAALGYRANPAARVLAGGRSRTLGVIAVETQQFGPSHMLYGIEAAARGAGHVLSFVTMAPGADEIGATLDHLRAAHVEGVIVIAPVRPVIDAVADLDADLPLVVVGGDPSVRTSTVTIDQEAGARMATAHLLGLGHRTVHHVSGPADWIDATDRQRAWAETLEAHGAPPGRFVEGDWTAQGGYAAGTQLAQDPTVTAVFAANDQTALGILRALHEHGRSVPDDVSVVGYDDIPEAAYLVPPLTTVRQDLGEVGRRGVELLLALVDGGPAQRHVMVAPELIVRASSAPPPT
ncbi:MAG TPA: LacI family DNA-binding transcriptional regulator [Acidimicrobiales bacterium]